MGIRIGGQDYDLGLPVEVYNWVTHPTQCPKATDTNPRAKFARAIVVHTVHGTADGGIAHMELDPNDMDPSGADLAYAKYQANTTRDVSWDFTLDIDGSIAQSSDPALEYCWHANQVNQFTIGMELVQAASGDVTDVQMKSFVALVDLLTRVEHPMMAIQRQMPYKDGKPYAGMIGRILAEQGSGSSVVGIYGHRNVWYRAKTGQLKSYRDPGDPGNAPFECLKLAGYETFDYEAKEDQAIWKQRQTLLGLPADGLPGPATREAAKTKASRPRGIWVIRPGDETC